ncbi:1,4-alpha-glucan branching enzyme [Intestinibacter sp.]|uniref:1,4-alpha-glucan branching enzyme n=1 Tax=Intestinibacter sp. TaxID=1965304 RepID=UPI002A90FE69|nr:1,4-alpha-glucan branching enzyme [Intestinibacter sp.]MDY5213015.1 1,4-alpha-glucan branching enzyme [Intestinibacter sp.]
MKNIHDFYCGTMFDAYEFFGAHVTTENGIKGIIFRVYAPNSKEVQVISDFNDWDGNKGKMKQIGNSGIFTYFSEDAKLGMYYKYLIFDQYGNCVEKTDPYAFYMELRPKNASRIVDLNTYKFNDQHWMMNRNKNFDRPLNIYELHFGSWKHKTNEEILRTRVIKQCANVGGDNGINANKLGHDLNLDNYINSEYDLNRPIDITERWFNYMEIAPELIKYVKENNYTHIEILPLFEHPSDSSWGYQITGFFSPTARYGKPEDLMAFIDLCHRENIGVIMDYVPVHFALDSYSLGRFGGRELYEYPDYDNRYTEWGSYSFNYYKGEVRSFLQSVANFWIKVYHIDGFRMDAISNIIYWKGDSNRGVNEGGIEFLKNMNQYIQKHHKDIMLIAEDSTDYPKVTEPVEKGGLGFDYKWDMGWMNDTLSFFQKEPWQRREAYHQITFSMMYFYSEKFLLPFSHDEVVHGKRTILDKMWGSYEDKFSQAKLLYTYMFTHPGKKLNFMGNELGHFREWDEMRELDWDLLKYPSHDSFHRFISDLNGFYMYSPLLYKDEYSRNCYKWIQADDTEKCVYVYERTYGDERIVIFLNAYCDNYENYQVRFDESVRLELILNTDWIKYGGKSEQAQEIVESVDLWHQDACHSYHRNTHVPHGNFKCTIFENPIHLSKKDLSGAGKNYQVSVSLPAFSAKIYRVIG